MIVKQGSRWSVALLVLALCSMTGRATAEDATKPLPLMPMPAKVERSQAQVLFPEGTALRFDAQQAGVAKVAKQFADRLASERGLHVSESPSGATIQFAIDPKLKLGDEGYRLLVDKDGAKVTAATSRGLFYGSVTLLQLMTPDDGAQGAVSVPGVRIEDRPRFRWRGLMIDSVRHMQTIDEMHSIIDQMAMHKLNTLHWHLSDDQGWRIEIKRYPKLTEIGAWRTPPDAGEDGAPTRYGGFYTQDEIRAMVAYAAERNITIVPEIDMPGHAQAAVASYPELGVTGKQPPVSVDWGVNTYLYNVDDHTFTFIQNVLDEVMALFPSRYIHLGGDEAVKDQWEASPAVQAKIKSLGLKDEEALQGWFMARLGRYLQSHGRRMIGWDEILAGNVPASATVMSWRGLKGAVEAAQKGHDVVSSPAPDLYLDQMQSDRADETTGRMPVRDLSSIYHFDPVPSELTPKQAARVIGAQANVWAEHMPTAAHRQHAIFPRLDALSEVLWSPPAKQDWNGFLQRLPTQLARYRADGVKYADSAFAANIVLDRNEAIVSGKATVSLNNQAKFGELHYTTNNTAPTLDSPRYDQPFEVTLPAIVRAVAFDAQGQPLAEERAQAIDIAHLATRLSGEMPNCPGNNFRLRVQPTPDATSLSPTYAVNLFDNCQMYPQARLDGVRSIHVDAVRLERNYSLAHEQKLVVERPAQTAFGELVIHKDTCDGPVLASMPLPDPKASGRRIPLTATLPATTGVHDLCLAFTGPISGPLYGIAQVSVIPQAAK